jgi:muramoyltetrapeptide carboxypeptidase
MNDPHPALRETGFGLQVRFTPFLSCSAGSINLETRLSPVQPLAYTSSVIRSLVRPRALTRSDHVAVLAISSPSELSRIEEGARHLEEMGLRVSLAPNIAHLGDRGYLAGNDDERAAVLNRFLADDSVDAFLFARGGYGAMRILDRVDYEAIRRNPRPIIGFSDLTALHQAVAIHSGVRSFHGPMVNLDFFDRLSSDREDWMWSMLAGEFPLTHRLEQQQVLLPGEAEGILFGGCLSLTTALTGTPYDYWQEGGIWFWEEVDESPYRIDRMLTHLRLSGRMNQIRGVVIGKLKDCGSESELTALFHDFFGSNGIPVIRDLPFGHQGNNLLMPIGTTVRISTPELTFTITEPAVEHR